MVVSSVAGVVGKRGIEQLVLEVASHYRPEMSRWGVTAAIANGDGVA
jgi:hypothetical protein